MGNKPLSAVFIDFENFYFSLTNLYEMTYRDAGEVVISLIADELDKLSSQKGEFIIRQAFADWSTFQGPKKELQKIGIRIIDVLSTEYKNSADIELSLAVLETVITRDDIDTIVIFAGDRDYMPVALRARERGRSLYFVGFEKSLSGDIKSLVGKSNYSYVTVETTPESKQHEKDTDSLDKLETKFSIEGLTPNEVKAAIAAVQAFDQYEVRFGCVKVSVFLVEGLANALPELEHFQRKQVFASLVEKEVIKTQQRMADYPDDLGNIIPYTVYIVNEDSSVVKAVRDNMKSSDQVARAILEKAAKDAADNKNYVLGANLGNVLKKLDPSFSPIKYGFGNLTEFIERYPDILVFEGKSGGDKKYKLTT
ncbi:MAG: NYN domain-containing protein [Thermoplasmataceae archaeon]